MGLLPEHSSPDHPLPTPHTQSPEQGAEGSTPHQQEAHLGPYNKLDTASALPAGISHSTTTCGPGQCQHSHTARAYTEGAGISKGHTGGKEVPAWHTTPNKGARNRTQLTRSLIETVPCPQRPLKIAWPSTTRPAPNRVLSTHLLPEWTDLPGERGVDQMPAKAPIQPEATTVAQSRNQKWTHRRKDPLTSQHEL